MHAREQPRKERCSAAQLIGRARAQRHEVLQYTQRVVYGLPITLVVFHRRGVVGGRQRIVKALEIGHEQFQHLVVQQHLHERLHGRRSSVVGRIDHIVVGELFQYLDRGRGHIRIVMREQVYHAHRRSLLKEHGVQHTGMGRQQDQGTQRTVQVGLRVNKAARIVGVLEAHRLILLDRPLQLHEQVARLGDIVGRASTALYAVRRIPVHNVENALLLVGQAAAKEAAAFLVIALVRLAHGIHLRVRLVVHARALRSRGLCHTLDVRDRGGHSARRRCAPLALVHRRCGYRRQLRSVGAAYLKQLAHIHPGRPRVEEGQAARLSTDGRLAPPPA